MPTSVRQDILLYKARGFSPRETHSAMQQDAAKGHGFGAAQGDQGVSLRSIRRVYEKMDKHGIIWNGGTVLGLLIVPSVSLDFSRLKLGRGQVLSFFGCERRENKKGTGTARLMDAPLAYLDAVNDGARCLCVTRCLSVGPSTHLSVHPSLRLPARLCAHLSVCW